jgi:hypothetical protein
LLLRAFKHSSGFTSSLYEFVSSCQELSLVPLKELTNSALTPVVLKVLCNLQLDGVFHMGQD